MIERAEATDTSPLTPSLKADSSARNSSTLVNICRIWRTRTSPAGLSITPFGVRSSRRRPTTSSNSWMRFVAADGAMFSRSAARPIWPSSTADRNNLSVKKSTCLNSRVLLNEDIACLGGYGLTCETDSPWILPCKRTPSRPKYGTQACSPLRHPCARTQTRSSRPRHGVAR